MNAWLAVSSPLVFVTTVLLAAVTVAAAAELRARIGVLRALTNGKRLGTIK